VSFVRFRYAFTLTLEIYISLSCHSCPDVVQALNLMAVQTRASTPR
jgi:alkyl hydroperoxide reductase subunit AhpF